MIIPIRCFTCGKVLAHLWEPYIEKLQEGTSKEMLEKEKKTLVIGVGEDLPKSTECRAMDDLGIERYCCRMTMMGTVDLTEDIVKN